MGMEPAVRMRTSKESFRLMESMARAQDPNSASSQFFIVHQDATYLDGQYAAFGKVTEGMDIVDKICEEAVDTDGNGLVAPDKQPVIEKITITD